MMPASLDSLTVAIDGRDRNVFIDFGAAAIKLFDVGMVVGIRQHPRDDSGAARSCASLGRAQGFDIGLWGVHKFLSTPIIRPGQWSVFAEKLRGM